MYKQRIILIENIESKDIKSKEYLSKLLKENNIFVISLGDKLNNANISFNYYFNDLSNNIQINSLKDMVICNVNLYSFLEDNKLTPEIDIIKKLYAIGEMYINTSNQFAPYCSIISNNDNIFSKFILELCKKNNYQYYLLQHIGLYNFISLNNHMVNKDNILEILSIKSLQQKKLNIVIILPSSRLGSSGYYIQDLAKFLVKLGHRCLILCENISPPLEDGVEWIQFAFKDSYLHPILKQKVYDFNPDVIYNIGFRAQSMRIAIELKLSFTNAIFVNQSEDDDYPIFFEKYPKAEIDLMQIAEQPKISEKQLLKFFKDMDWEFTYSIFNNPTSYRYVEPLMRMFIFKFTDIHTAIWHPYAKEIKEKTNKKAIIIPPAVDLNLYNDIMISDTDKIALYQKYNIHNDSLVIFISGTIYNYSPEFKIFIRAVDKLAKLENITLVITGSSRNIPKLDLFFNSNNKINFISMNKPNDQDYLNMVKACDIIAAPGFNDRFNRLRLPSRLVKAMLYAKAIFTFHIGFGESLTHMHHAVLTYTNDEQEWFEGLLLLRDKDLRNKLGQNARIFALENFSAEYYAKILEQQLYDKYNKINTLSYKKTVKI